MIKTVHGSDEDKDSKIYSAQEDILRSIIELHLRPIGCDKFELDATYGNGNFYKFSGIPEPSLKYDLKPRFEHVSVGDSRNLPIPDDSVTSAVFDPPFIHAHGKDSIIGNIFSSYKNQTVLHEMYAESLAEHYRVIEYEGVLVFKCQDIVESGQQVWSHINIYNYAMEIGFKMIDLFILVSGHRIQGHNHGNQKHARKSHTYFLVFKKTRKGHKCNVH